MIRRLARAGVMVCLTALVGCNSDSRDGLIRSTSNQLSEATTSVDGISTKLKDYLKSKEARNEDAAKKDLEEAVTSSKKLKEIARELQTLYRKADSAAPTSDEERKALREANQANIKSFAANVVSLSEKHREMKLALAEVTKKYGEEPIRPLLQEIQEADTEFAAITRKR